MVVVYPPTPFFYFPSVRGGWATFLHEEEVSWKGLAKPLLESPTEKAASCLGCREHKPGKG